MSYEGNLRKLKTALVPGQEVQYRLVLGENEVLLNDRIEQPITLRFEGRINCISCGRLTRKAFGQGFCYPCFQNSPMNAECIVRPELCKAHEGKGRDVAWEREHHLQPHFVYLAQTSAIKVGVTRATQIPTRWIDQGAWRAVRFAYTDYRQQAGALEVLLKEHLSDKTPWQRMLRNEQGTEDLLEVKHNLQALLPETWQAFVSPDDTITEIRYPVMTYPQKVRSVKLDKQPVISGTLEGIRGQYLILDGGRVVNLRAHSGYYVFWEE